MSISLDSTDAYIARTANLPTTSGATIGAWLYFDSFSGSTNEAIFYLGSSGGGTTFAALRWNFATSKLRIHNTVGSADLTAAPSTGQWIYAFLRTNGTTVSAGWKTIAESDFTTSGHTGSSTGNTGTTAILRVGANLSVSTAADMRVYRLDVWDEYATDENILLAAATDKGYTTNLNTHLPLTDGIGSPYADTSGNARDWTANGTINNAGDPSLSSDVTVAASGSAMTGGSGTKSPLFEIPL